MTQPRSAWGRQSLALSPSCSAGAGGVAHPAEDAAEDPVGAAGGAGLAELLGEAERLLGGVDGQHVLAALQIQRRGVAVEADELERLRRFLEQVDPGLVAGDRA